MFRSGPWWKGLGASASGSPRRNSILAIATAAALLATGLSFLTPWKLVER
jgi:adenylate cyclase